ncbi:hypothetical protein SARC_10387 [Sphaeroforma arctica JP610]|uniref:Uncharacterized protein n=1 Tax=Sphaeroforma arctica JP610 TaxID=667725 RepID=A0A0L0FL10_9EUKA|nr:hypothetical protein SARC_10387 [Sphaeroforma arctica JP610]KNC77146.1 hypothetical protein SARC_10387 [Sphaeroforma arctica JP610]|eukprot:XP_014151048.1 hypothetical protein SARC_10387 [Sphaeroforma arctica JP610]
MKPANGTDTKDSFEELVRCMIGGSWSHILDALSIVLHKSSDEKNGQASANGCVADVCRGIELRDVVV